MKKNKKFSYALMALLLLLSFITTKFPYHTGMESGKTYQSFALSDDDDEDVKHTPLW